MALLDTILSAAADSRTLPSLQNTMRPLRLSAVVTCVLFRSTLLRTLLLETHVQTALPVNAGPFARVDRNPVVTVVLTVQMRFRLSGFDAPLTLWRTLILGRFAAGSFYRCNRVTLLKAKNFVRASLVQSTGVTRFGLRKNSLCLCYAVLKGLQARNLAKRRPTKLVLFTVLLGRFDPVPLMVE